MAAASCSPSAPFPQRARASRFDRPGPGLDGSESRVDGGHRRICRDWVRPVLRE